MNISHATCESLITAIEFPLASACLIAQAIAVFPAVLVQRVCTEAKVINIECLEQFAIIGLCDVSVNDATVPAEIISELSR